MPSSTDSDAPQGAATTETFDAAGGLHPDAPFRRALVVANPVAGRGSGQKAGREVTEGLNRLGVSTELHLTSERGDGRARVRCLDQDVDLVVSVGGDGTLREVFDGLCNLDTAVATVPLGTANVLGLDLGLPRDVDSVLEVIAGRKTVAIDLARVNGHVSFLVTGVGLDAAIVRELELRRDGPITKWDYTGAILHALRGYEPPRMSVEVDGELVGKDIELVLVSNIINYGGFLKLSADRQLDDGLYEVYLFRDASPRKLLSVAVRGFLSHLPKKGGGSLEVRRARTVRVSSEEPVPYQVDGDFRGVTPVEVVVGERQVRLLVP